MKYVFSSMLSISFRDSSGERKIKENDRLFSAAKIARLKNTSSLLNRKLDY